MRALDPTIAHMRNVYLVLGDDVEHGVGGAARESDKLSTMLRSEHLFEIIGVVFEAGNDLPAIASGAAIAWLLGLKNDCLNAALGKMQGGREPRIARAMTQTSACVVSTNAGVNGAGGAVALHNEGSRGNGSAI